MAVINPEKIADLLAECAEAYVLPRYQQLKDEEISSKTGPQDLVTQADIDVEAHLERVLPDILPGSLVLGEEGVSRGDHSLDILQRNDEVIWVVDPVDGTYNFVHGKREFAVMLACVINGRTEYSWIYDVLGNKCAIVERGSGAYFGGERMAVDRSKKSNEELVGFVNGRHFPESCKEGIKAFSEMFKSCGALRCAGHEYLRIARGDADFALFNNRLKSWDHLPGALMVEEAGGCVAKWDNSSYTPKDNRRGVIVSYNKDIWSAVRSSFLDLMPEHFSLGKICL